MWGCARPQYNGLMLLVLSSSGAIVLWCNLQLQLRCSERSLAVQIQWWTHCGLEWDDAWSRIISGLFTTLSLECWWHGLDLKFNDRAQHHSLWHCCRHWRRSYSSSAFAQSIRGFYTDCWIDNCINKKATPAKLNKQTLSSLREANQTTLRICRSKCKVFEKHIHSIT